MKCPKCGKDHLTESTVDTNTKKVHCKDCGFMEMRDSRNLPLLTEVPAAAGPSLVG